MRTLFCSLRVLILMLAGTTAHAADDVVALTSGNRMTGEIRGLSRGQLEFRIAGVGTVTIEWRNVVELRSEQPLDVELTSGERHIGALSSASPGTLEVRTDTGPIAVKLEDIVRIDPIKARFTDRLTGSMDLGLDFLTANDEVDWTFNGEVSHPTVNYRTDVTISSLLRRRSNETAQRRNDLRIKLRRFLERRWFAIGEFEAEEDRELDLDSRFLIGAGIGRTLVQTNRTVFAMYGGTDVARERYRGFATNDVPEILAAIEWDLFDLGGDVQLLIAATTYLGLNESRTRVELDCSLRKEFFSNFYWSLNVFESYNSNPPPGLAKSDFGVSLGVGRSF